MVRRILLCALASGALLGTAGCRHCCRSCGPAPRPYLPNPPGGGFTNVPGRGIPPTAVPTSPFAPPPGMLIPADGATIPPPAAVIPREGNFRPQPAPSVPAFPPAPRPGPEVLFPSTPPTTAPQSVVPLSGQTPEPPLSVQPPAPKPEASAELPGYVDVKTGVAAGMRPTSQGFAVLKEKGFRTVVFLHAPGADTTAERDMVEKQGLTFAAVEVSPLTLADALAKVNARVADKTAHPAYVFANDSRGAAVWYLHFRTTDNDSDDRAKVRADRLGMSTTDAAFWIEINQILAAR